MRIVITGHTGFVGQHLVTALKKAGHSITGLSRSEGKDVTLKESFDGLPGFDVLIHLAAQSSIPLSFEQPAVFYHDNFIATLNCLEACRKNNAKIIYLSSYVYGQPQFLPITEEHPVQPANPYTASKFLGEQLCNAYHRDFKLPVTIVRPFNIYGKGQAGGFLLPTILNQLPSGEIRLQDARPKRDFIHVADLVGALLLILDSTRDFTVYNIGSGISYSIGDIINILSSASMIDEGKVFFGNELRKNEVLETVADISKAGKELGWYPEKDFKQEIVSLARESLGKFDNQLQDGRSS